MRVQKDRQCALETSEHERPREDTRFNDFGTEMARSNRRYTCILPFVPRDRRS
jgi:hypothetical protein